jgi:parallel beta-helix repeat protein
MKTAVAWRAAMASDTGSQRTNNEDRVYIDETQGLFLVIDGMGGHAGGERAAEMAAEIIPRQLDMLAGPVEDRVRTAITVANNQIFERSQQDDGLRGMACVLTLALLNDEKLTVGHVGDSRLYLVWNGTLKKLTSDHSPVGEQEDQGGLTEAEAMGHPRRNEVFRDVGSRLRDVSDPEFIDIKALPFHPEAAVLLCSDGLSDVLTSGEIAAVLEQYDGDPRHVVQMLVAAANAAGSRDNVSAIFVAGPEYLGTATQVTAETRARHSTTRVRTGSKGYGSWMGRVAWLVAGMILGALSWIGIERNMPRSPRPDSSGRVTHYSVDSTNAHGISNALSTAQPGDVIEIPPGQYLGPIYLKDGVVLTSRVLKGATIRADPSAPSDADTAIVARGIKSGRLSGVRVEGDAAHPLRLGLVVANSALDIDGVDVSGARDAAVAVSGASNVVLQNNTIHDNSGAGIRSDRSSKTELVNNAISGNAER